MVSFRFASSAVAFLLAAGALGAPLDSSGKLGRLCFSLTFHELTNGFLISRLAEWAACKALTEMFQSFDLHRLQACPRRLRLQQQGLHVEVQLGLHKVRHQVQGQDHDQKDHYKDDDNQGRV